MITCYTSVAAANANATLRVVSRRRMMMICRRRCRFGLRGDVHNNNNNNNNTSSSLLWLKQQQQRQARCSSISVATGVVDTSTSSPNERWRRRSMSSEASIPSSVSPLLNREEDDPYFSDDDDDEEEEEAGDDMPWKTLLDMPARAAWRVAQHETQHAGTAFLRHAQNVVLEQGKATWFNSNKQLLQTLRQVSESHRRLANRRERERLRAYRNDEWKRKKKKNDEADDNAAASKLLVYYGPMETLSNVKHRLLPNYAVARRVLRETKSLVVGSSDQQQQPPFRPKRVLDFGMGCGSASAAALDVFSDAPVEWIHGIEPSQTMREASQRVLQEYIQQQQQQQHSRNSSIAEDSDAGSDDDDDGAVVNTLHCPPPRITQAAHLSSTTSSSSSLVGTEATARHFDLCLFSYTACELPHDASTLAAAAMLWEKLNPNGGIFVMIEPGTPDGFSSIRQVRNMLLDCCPPSSSHDYNSNEEEEEETAQDECHILAPCTHSRACPMERSILSKPFGKQRQQNAEQSTQQHDVVFVADDDENDDDEDNKLAEFYELEEEEEEEAEEIDDRWKRKGFCSFVHSMPAAGGPRSKTEKFSYLVAQKRTRGSSSTSTLTADGSDDDEAFRFDNIRLSELLDQTLQQHEEATMTMSQAHHDSLGRQAASLSAKYLDSDQDDLGLEFVRGDVNRSSFGRIIHAPKKNKAHVLIDCCSNGRIVRHKIPKSLSLRAPGIYAAARKSRWGGLWPGSEHTEDDSHRREDK